MNTAIEAVRAEMATFWGIGPGSNDQLASLAEHLRELDEDEVEILGAFIPNGANDGSPIDNRCKRLHLVIQGVLKEKQRGEPKKKPGRKILGRSK